MARLGDIPGLALSLVIIASIAGVGAVVLTKISDQVNDTTATSIISTGKSSISDMVGWLPTIVVVVMGALVIGVLITSFKGSE